MRSFTAILIGGFIVCGCSQGDSSGPGETAEPQEAKETNDYSSGNPLTAPTDYLGAVSKAQKNSVSTLSLTSVQQGIQAFQAGEGRKPQSLQELVDEGYLPRMPDAPRGMQFKYDASAGTVSLEAAE